MRQLSTAIGLGTLLRHLLELLDGDVQRAYDELGLDYRPRYTPVVAALLDLGPSSIQDIARAAGITHSAASQTVAQMAEKGLVRLRPGRDLRHRVVHVGTKLEQMLPALRRQWTAAAAAAAALDAELPSGLAEVARAAIEALERVPFRARMRTAGSAKRVRKSREESDAQAV
jgi:DNA-binding MarR family transcriptional regulator